MRMDGRGIHWSISPMVRFERRSVWRGRLAVWLRIWLCSRPLVTDAACASCSPSAFSRSGPVTGWSAIMWVECGAGGRPLVVSPFVRHLLTLCSLLDWRCVQGRWDFGPTDYWINQWVSSDLELCHCHQYVWFSSIGFVFLAWVLTTSSSHSRCSACRSTRKKIALPEFECRHVDHLYCVDSCHCILQHQWRSDRCEFGSGYHPVILLCV